MTVPRWPPTNRYLALGKQAHKAVGRRAVMLLITYPLMAWHMPSGSSR